VAKSRSSNLGAIGGITFAISKLDAIPLALSVLQGAITITGPLCHGYADSTFAALWVAFYSISICWSSNTISHIHLHGPLFGQRWINRLFSFYLSILLGIPQSLWRERHLRHHAGQPTKWKSRPFFRYLPHEIGAISAWWAIMSLLDTSFFLKIYIPSYALGLALCSIQGRYEHRLRGQIRLAGVSYYSRIYNIIWLNDGYHFEHLLATLILVSLNDLVSLDFVAGARIVRSKRDPGSGPPFLDVTWRSPRRGQVGKVLSLARLFSYFLGREWSPYLVQAHGFRARRRRG
jgi:fatty acid desaturase